MVSLLVARMLADQKLLLLSPVLLEHDELLIVAHVVAHLAVHGAALLALLSTAALVEAVA